MSVNIRKCEVLVIHPHSSIREFVRKSCSVGMRNPAIHGAQIQMMPWVTRARYLGIFHDSEKTFESCVAELLAKGQRAMFALVDKLRLKGLLSPNVSLNCFNVGVRSILSFAVQVWGPAFLLEISQGLGDGRSHCFDKALNNKMVQVQRDFLQYIAGVKKVPYRLLFREFGQYPLHVHWAKLVFRFWNNIVRKPGSIHHHVLRDEIRLAIGSNLEGKGWGALVLKVLQLLGHFEGISPTMSVDEQVDLISVMELDVGALVDELISRFDDDWGSSRLQIDPRDFVSDGQQPGVKMCRYEQWMEPASHCSIYIPRKHHVSLMRFRLCVWETEVNRPTGRARSDRKCPACHIDGAIEDEKHILLECPRYADLRADLWTLGVASNASMKQVMCLDNQKALAGIVHRMYGSRSAG